MEITPQALCCAGQLLTQLRKLLKDEGALSEEAATLIHDIRQLLSKGKNEANRLAGQRDDARKEKDEAIQDKKAAEAEAKEYKKKYEALLRDSERMRNASEKLGAEVEALQQKSKSLQQKAADAEKARAAAAKTAATAGKKQEKAKKDVEERDATITALKKALREARAELRKASKAAGQDADTIKALTRKVDSLEAELTKAQVRLRKDHTNSGLSSSLFPNRKVRRNSTRKPSGRRPGAQVNHKHHGRKKVEGFVASREKVPVPEEFLDRKRYRPTGETKVHQLQDGIFIPYIHEMEAEGYLDLRTGKVVFPKFPPEFANDVNISGRLKAFLLLLVNYNNVAIRGASQVLQYLSGGVYKFSTGFVSELTREFAEKTEEERDKIFDAIVKADIVCADFSFARVDGKTGTVLITANDKGQVLFQARPVKGLKAIPGSPLEFFDGILVSDHEVTFVLHCGKLHQECLQHVLRILEEIRQTEHMLKWPRKMIKWIKDAIHYRNEVMREKVVPTEEKANGFLKAFHEIVELAENEYAQYKEQGGRPLRGYKGGVNLFNRLKDHSDDYYRFLTDLRIPPTNWLPEQCARVLKRKAHQVMCFRSFDGLAYWCDTQSVLREFLKSGDAMFDMVAEVFERPNPNRRGPNKGKTAAIEEAMRVDPESEVLKEYVRERMAPREKPA